MTKFKNNVLNIAALQISKFPKVTSNKWDYYIKICKNSNVKVLLFPEYVSTPFFRDINSTNRVKIEEETNNFLNFLTQLSQKCGITMVIPSFEFQENKIYKTIFIFSEGKTKRYRQQRLIPYAHWNEKRFFSNMEKKDIKPITFSLEDFKFGVLFGFELHLDRFFVELKKKKIDCLLLPTASTFNSVDRWRDIIKMRSFIGSFYTLRANRIGEYADNKGDIWDFYGNSMICLPDGTLEGELERKEDLLISTISKSLVKEQRNFWKFKD